MSGLRAYATLMQFHDRRDTKAADRTNATLNGRLLVKLRTASQRIEERARRTFQPELVARKFDYASDSFVDFHGYELLSLTSLVDGNSLSTPTANVALLGNSPYWALELDSVATRLTYSTTRVKAITVTGVWGFHDDYASAWHASGLTVSDNPLTSAATTVNLTGAVDPLTVTDAWGQVGAVSPGRLIQIDSEWMQVVATATGALTVVRAANGTTATSHVQTSVISVFEPIFAVRELCLRWASYLEAQDSNDFEKTSTTPLGVKMVPPGLPSDIEDALAALGRQAV